MLLWTRDDADGKKEDIFKPGNNLHEASVPPANRLARELL